MLLYLVKSSSDERHSGCGILLFKFQLGWSWFFFHSFNHDDIVRSFLSTLNISQCFCLIVAHCFSLSMHDSQISIHCSPLIDDQSPRVNPFKFWGTIPQVAVLSSNLMKIRMTHRAASGDPSNYKDSLILYSNYCYGQFQAYWDCLKCPL